MSAQFSAAAEKEFQDILTRYPRKDAALLPVLWLAQKEFGFLSAETRAYVAEKLETSVARVESVVSFYTLYRTRDMGKHHLQVCRNLSCALRGADKLMNYCEKELGLKSGETTSDGLLSYEKVECLAACGGAPAIQIDGMYYEDLTPKKLEELIGRLKDRG